MTNVNVAATQLLPAAGADNSGLKIGILDSATKAAQNDTLTVTNADTVVFALATTDASGVADPVTISTNVLTLTSATAGSATIVVYYK